jgi:hypothetical protein
MRWLQWIIDNPMVAVIIAGVLAQMFKAITGKKGAEEEEGAPSPERSFEDPELAERTRKIREDIQRKIAQRSKGGEAPPAPAPAERREPDDMPELPPIFREILQPEAPRPAPARAAVSHAEAQRMAEILEQQAALAEQLKQAKEMKALAAKRAQFEEATADKTGAAKVAQTGALKDDLRDPAALRRAFVLREVLGPPLALR